MTVRICPHLGLEILFVPVRDSDIEPEIRSYQQGAIIAGFLRDRYVPRRTRDQLWCDLGRPYRRTTTRLTKPHAFDLNDRNDSRQIHHGPRSAGTGGRFRRRRRRPYQTDSPRRRRVDILDDLGAPLARFDFVDPLHCRFTPRFAVRRQRQRRSQRQGGRDVRDGPERQIPPAPEHLGYETRAPTQTPRQLRPRHASGFESLRQRLGHVEDQLFLPHQMVEILTARSRQFLCRHLVFL